MRFENVEACMAQFGAKRVHGPPVCRGNRVSKLTNRLALKEPYKQCASGFEYAAELAQGNLDCTGLVVDQRGAGSLATEVPQPPVAAEMPVYPARWKYPQRCLICDTNSVS